MKGMFFCLFFFVILAADCFGQANPLAGAWELVSAKRTYSESSEEWNANGSRVLRIVNETHFSKISGSDDGSVKEIIAGSYVAKGKKITLRLKFSSRVAWRQTRLVATFSIEGDTCKLSLVSPADSAKVEEILRRVK